MKLFIVCLLVCAASAAAVNRAIGTSSNGLSCDYFFKEHNGWCYFFSSQPAPDGGWFNLENTHDESMKFCREMDGDLVSIHSSDENDFLLRNFPNAWIGLRYDQGQFAWSDGTPVDYKNLTSNFLDVAEYLGECVIIGSNDWKNAECKTEEYYSICKKKPSEFPTTGCPNPNEIHYDGGEIHSPGSPFPYYGPGNCVWKLNVKNDMLIQLNFSLLWLEDGQTLDIYEGWNKYTPLAHLNKRDAGTNPVFQTKKLNRMLIVLNIENLRRLYFRATFSTIDATNNDKNRSDNVKLGMLNNLSEAFMEKEKEEEEGDDMPKMMGIENEAH